MTDHFGPSHESIEVTHMLQMAWYDDHVHQVTDFGGETFTAYNAPDWEVEAVAARMQQLEDLMDLRNPLPWADAVLTRQCPCGMDNAEWQALQEYLNNDAEDDMLGAYHGRNI